MRTTVKVREKYQVTIPEDVREKIPLKIGERVEVTARGDEIVIHPVVEIPRSQQWFWSEEWQKRIEKSMQDIRDGKVKTFKTINEAKRHFGD